MGLSDVKLSRERKQERPAHLRPGLRPEQAVSSTGACVCVLAATGPRPYVLLRRRSDSSHNMLTLPAGEPITCGESTAARWVGGLSPAASHKAGLNQTYLENDGGGGSSSMLLHINNTVVKKKNFIRSITMCQSWKFVAPPHPTSMYLSSPRLSLIARLCI